MLLAATFEDHVALFEGAVAVHFNAGPRKRRWGFHQQPSVHQSMKGHFQNHKPTDLANKAKNCPSQPAGDRDHNAVVEDDWMLQAQLGISARQKPGARKCRARVAMEQIVCGVQAGSLNPIEDQRVLLAGSPL